MQKVTNANGYRYGDRAASAGHNPGAARYGYASWAIRDDQQIKELKAPGGILFWWMVNQQKGYRDKSS